MTTGGNGGITYKVFPILGSRLKTGNMATNVNLTQSGDGTMLRSGTVLGESSSTSHVENSGLGDGSVRRKTPVVNRPSQDAPDVNVDDNDIQAPDISVHNMLEIIAQLQHAQANNGQGFNVAPQVNQGQAVQVNAPVAAPVAAPVVPPYQHMGDRGMGSSKMKPPIYDGNSSWPEYLMQFKLVAELNSWNDRTKALYLATSLRGVARSVLADMDPEEHHIFRAIVHCLNQRFSPDNQSEMFWMLLSNRTRKPQETLPELAHEIRKLVRLAHPTAQHVMLEELAMRHFSNALSSADMRLRIAGARPRTLDDAVKIAVETEAFQEAEKFRAVSKKPVRAVATDNAVESDKTATLLAALASSMDTLVKQMNLKTGSGGGGGRTDCFYCGKPGHFKRNCTKFREKYSLPLE